MEIVKVLNKGIKFNFFICEKCFGHISEALVIDFQDRNFYVCEGCIKEGLEKL